MNRGLGVATFLGMESPYERAVKLLNSRRRLARPSPSVGAKTSAGPRGTPSLEGMRTWLNQIGHTDSEIDQLNVVHVAGTKGKGATCAFVNFFLQAHGDRTGYPKRIGLYTSPHLRFIQERIRINSKPLSEDLFAKYVLEVWNKLKHDGSHEPRYLQLLLLTSIHAFITEKVDFAVIETHNGGEFDATNVIRKPVATGIATIGMDHIDQLGPTIEKIAWHKSGIFKPQVPAFSVPQVHEAATILQDRASEIDVSLEWTEIDARLAEDPELLRPEVQRINASLAIALSNAALSKRTSGAYKALSASDVQAALQEFVWDGRFHRVIDGNDQWFLDGAHNELSVQKAASWFADETSAERRLMETAQKTRIVIFSQISDRDGAAILRQLAQILAERKVSIKHLIITTYDEKEEGSFEASRRIQPLEQRFPSAMQDEYINAWKGIDPKIHAVFEPTVEEALKQARNLTNNKHGMQTLITGSLYLIGSALRLLDALDVTAGRSAS